MKTSPTQRTLKLFRGEGWTADVVEKWIPMARVRKDVFGFGDVLAMKPAACFAISGLDQFDQQKNETISSPGMIALLQACSGGDHAARRDKILAEPRAKTWLQSGGRIAVVSWAKRGDRLKRKLWTCRVEWIELHHFEPKPVEPF